MYQGLGGLNNFARIFGTGKICRYILGKTLIQFNQYRSMRDLLADFCLKHFFTVRLYWLTFSILLKVLSSSLNVLLSIGIRCFYLQFSNIIIVFIPKTVLL